MSEAVSPYFADGTTCSVSEQPPPPPSEQRTIVDEGPAGPPPGRRVVVDETPPRQSPWAWLLAALFLAAAIVFFVLWLLGRDNGSDTRATPNLIGMRQVEAQREAQSRGFRLTTVERIANAAAGTVLDQAPEPGAALEKNARMMAIVSSGQARVTVPKLIGLKRSAAERVVQPIGLSLRVLIVPSERGGGIVLAQNPSEGAQVPKGSTIQVNVSRGPGLVSVPALQGLTIDRATGELTDAGLVPVVIQVPSTEPANTVIAQDPPSGQKVKRGTQVRINVSRGPASTNQETVIVTTSATTTRRSTTTVETTTP